MLFRTACRAIRAAPGAYVKGVALGLTGLLLLPYTEAVESNGPAAVAGTPIGDAVLGPPGRGRRLRPDVLTSGALWARAPRQELEPRRHRAVHRRRRAAQPPRRDLAARATSAGLVRPRRRRAVRHAPGAAPPVRPGHVERRSTPGARPGAPGGGRSSCRRAGSGSSWSFVFCLRFRPSGLAAPLLVAGSGMLVLLETALAFPPSPDYALPFVPAFALVAVAAVARGQRGRRPTEFST